MISTTQNLPDMRQKVKEYINDLLAEIGRCEERMGMEDIDTDFVRCGIIRVETLNEVINDLQERLSEVI